MKSLLLSTLFSVAAVAPLSSFAQPTFSHLAEDPLGTLDAESLDYLMSRVRVSVGMQRDTVVEQMGEPRVVLHRDVWVYTRFLASNVFGTEKYNALLVVFKDDKVDKITLTEAKAILTAGLQRKSATRIGQVAKP